MSRRIVTEIARDEIVQLRMVNCEELKSSRSVNPIMVCVPVSLGIQLEVGGRHKKGWIPG
jgi:hypothetical protein